METDWGGFMHRETAHSTRRSRSLVVLLLALGVIAVFGIAAQQALAYSTYQHDTATSCASCHPGGDTSVKPTNANCIGCHANYVTLASGKTCWTCHTPGQAMATVKTGAPGTCTTVCHLASGTDSTHVAHPARPATCTSCHPLTASATNPNNSPHHSLTAPATAILTSFVPTLGPVGTHVVITGFGFTGATVVAFHGTPALTFTIDSDTQITATVPVGATTGKIAITPASGPVVTSVASFTVGVVAPKITITSAASVKVNKLITISGKVTPISLAGRSVTITIQKKSGTKWKTLRTASAKISVAGAYSYKYKPTSKGTYHAKGALAAKAGVNKAASSLWKTFKVR
jgi:hypothetical protein